MVRHVVLFRFEPGTSAAEKQAVRDGLTELRGAIAEIERYEFGPDLGFADGNFDFAVVADFADADAFKTYAAHPRHKQLVAERIAPILAERVAVQFEF